MSASGQAPGHGHGHGPGHGNGSEEPPKFDAASWDERYLTKESLWSGRPNPVLVDEAADLAPGRALDVGCGEGADALWLAARGWRVWGVDVSQVALDRAAGHAAAVGVGDLVTWEQRDLFAWAPEEQTFDLVSAQFFHVPSADRPRLYGGLAGAVAPGGTLLVVAHHPSDLETTMGRPTIEDLFFTADEIAGLLDPGAWEVLAMDTRRRTATDPDGHEVSIQDAVLRARRAA